MSNLKEGETIVFLFIYDNNTPDNLIREMKHVKGVTCVKSTPQRVCYFNNNSKNIKLKGFPSYVVSDGNDTKVVETKEEFLKIIQGLCEDCT